MRTLTRTLVWTLWFASLGAFAQGVVTSTDAPQVAAVLAAHGYKFSLDKDEEGAPLIQLEIAGGYSAFLFFYDDDPAQPGYESLQLYTAFATEGRVSLQTVNDWNYSYRFAKVYLDDDLDPVLESDLDLAGGVDLEGTLAIFLQNYEAAFETFLGEVVGE
ncbi:YbjN domain-containing protein [Oceanithermus sp.]|uniref:YbjN domain-containing protein n=1 Tax=Oceanithermus sp. TaxID=2268145 RepID=UPI0025CC5783|nr:YbjN domain-containing protein [Oceanithermus sp.]